VLFSSRRAEKGGYSGTGIDPQDALKFSGLPGLRPTNEVVPLERVAEAHERRMSGQAQFRVVLTMGR
jgi:D-arabinose 1-dehydrogenase-like Zn-dependent alcohol dehydrogenase